MTSSVWDKPSKIKYYLRTILVAIILGLVFTLAIGYLCGWRLRIVTTNSMEPNIKVGTLILESKRSYDQLQVGDVITFFRPVEKGVKVTHRIIEKYDDKVLVKGDNPASDTIDEVTADNYVGYVAMTVPGVQYLIDYLVDHTFALLYVVVMCFIAYQILLT